jgi:GNAT superfamily N-acetyltransferase
LQDAVDSGASVGFIAPLADIDAYHYWMKAFVQLTLKGRIILATVHDSTIVGSVQLELASMPNASHRAEVQKLLVLRWWRRQGTGLTLMTAIEETARRAGRLLLVLDTPSCGGAVVHSYGLHTGRCHSSIGLEFDGDAGCDGSLLL